jgi:hypothetical protein
LSVPRVEAVGGEQPVGALGGGATGVVVVGGHDRVLPISGELSRLLVGEGGAEGCDAEVAGVGGEGDGDGVERSFNEDRDRAVPVWLVEDPVKLVALVEQRGGGGVEVLRSGVVGVVPVGLAAADEPEDLPVRDDGEEESVAEAVDESAGAGDGGQAGGGEFLVGDAVASQVGGKGGPGVRGLSGSVVGVAGKVGL